MRSGLVIFLVFIQIGCTGQIPVNELLSRLDEVIDNREYFVELKQERIDAIKRDFLFEERSADANLQYAYYQSLSSEYMTFKFDSAFHYAKKLLEVAYLNDERDSIVLAQIEFANILITAGIFSEAMDTLKSIELTDASKQSRAAYFIVMSRGYFDMESFSQSKYYSARYRELGVSYFDSAMSCYAPDTWQYHSLIAQKFIKAENSQMAIEILTNLISTYPLSNDELAIQLMLLSFSYNIQGEPDQALKYMVDASVADFMGAKKEAVALVFVANALFEMGEVIKASKYINVAIEESSFYGSNFRLWQISQYSPIIKSEHIITIENQKHQLLKYLIIVSVLSVMLVLSFTVIYRQIRKLQRVKKILEATNRKLGSINEELILANKIKEEYIGYYFSVSSQMIEKLDKFKNSIYRKFSRRQFDELALELDSINIHKEKLFLYNKFDQVFLQIFPNFVEKMNALLRDEEQLLPKTGHLLNTELRIYALFRLGINDNEKIAKILDNSVNTIYTYKTKVRHMAKLSKEEFEAEVMKIKRF